MTQNPIEKGKYTGKERLIQATEALLMERTFDDITIEEIIKAAELSRPAFYYHFTGGKEELRTELVNRGMLADMVVKGRKRITEYVRKRQEEGYFCKHIEPGLLVQAIAAIFAMRAVGRGLEELLPYGYLPREEFINQLVSLLLYGMVRRDQLSSGEVEASA